MLLLNKRTDGGYQFLMILYCHRKLVFRHFKRRAFFCHGNKLNCVFRIYPENQSTSSRSLIFKNLLRKKKVNGNKKKRSHAPDVINYFSTWESGLYKKK